jgi:hypothetical protein
MLHEPTEQPLKLIGSYCKGARLGSHDDVLSARLTPNDEAAELHTMKDLTHHSADKPYMGIIMPVLSAYNTALSLHDIPS